MTTLAAILLLVCASTARAADATVAAVFSSESGPYQEALSGFDETVGTVPQTVFLSNADAKLPESAKVVVTFGAKAALKGYPSGTALVYAMAPALELDREATAIRMEPEPDVLLSCVHRIAPNVKRLGIVWQSARYGKYVASVRKLGESRTISIEDAPVGDDRSLPDALRSLYGKIDALWLPPDPLLINAQTLPVLLDFSRANRVPLFAPTAGLVEQGATASIGPDFKEIGRAAGRAAREALEGPAKRNRQVYAARVEIVLNQAAAKEIGLTFPDEALHAADRVLP